MSTSNVSINVSKKEENISAAIIASANEKGKTNISPNSTVFEPSTTVHKGSVVKLSSSKLKKMDLQKKTENRY